MCTNQKSILYLCMLSVSICTSHGKTQDVYKIITSGKERNYYQGCLSGGVRAIEARNFTLLKVYFKK